MSSAFGAVAGDVYRKVEAPFGNARDLLSGLGAAHHGQRWNPPGVIAVYACLDESLATLEWQAQRTKAGMPVRQFPRTEVTIIASLHHVLDLRRPEVIAAGTAQGDMGAAIGCCLVEGT